MLSPYQVWKSAIVTRYLKRDLEIVEGTLVGVSPRATQTYNSSAPVQGVGESRTCRRTKLKEDVEVATLRSKQMLPLIDTRSSKIPKEPTDLTTPTSRALFGVGWNIAKAGRG